MWAEQQSLQLSVVMGLRKGLSRIRGMKRSLTEEDQRKIAEETSNWKIALGPPLEGGRWCCIHCWSSKRIEPFSLQSNWMIMQGPPSTSTTRSDQEHNTAGLGSRELLAFRLSVAAPLLFTKAATSGRMSGGRNRPTSYFYWVNEIKCDLENL
jgi:hypothetical protein